MNKRNSEGYSDPTAYAALSKMEREEAHLRKLKAALSQVCELSGYRLKGQIFLVDKKTGQTFKF